MYTHVLVNENMHIHVHVNFNNSFRCQLMIRLLFRMKRGYTSVQLNIFVVVVVVTFLRVKTQYGNSKYYCKVLLLL